MKQRKEEALVRQKFRLVVNKKTEKQVKILSRNFKSLLRKMVEEPEALKSTKL